MNSRILIYKDLTANHIRVKYWQSFIGLFLPPGTDDPNSNNILEAPLSRATHSMLLFLSSNPSYTHDHLSSQ